MSKSKKEILVEAEVSIKKSPDLRQVSHKATAGMSEAEAIERHTIGEYHRERTEGESEQEEG